MFVRAYSPAAPAAPAAAPRACEPQGSTRAPSRPDTFECSDRCPVAPPTDAAAREQARQALDRILGPLPTGGTPAPAPLPEPSSTRAGRILDVLCRPPAGVDAAAFRAEVVRYAEQRGQLGDVLDGAKRIDQAAALAMGVQGLSAAEAAGLRERHPGGMPRLDALIEAGPAAVRDAALAAGAKVDALSAAREKLGPLNEQLAKELAQVGPALTAKEREQYTLDFQASHPEYAAEKRLLGELGELTSSKRALLNTALETCPDTALPKIFDAWAAVAQSAGAKSALDWVETLPPAAEAALRKSPYGERVADEIIGPAIDALAVKTCGDLTGEQPDPKSAAQAIDQFKSAVQQYQKLDGWRKSGQKIGEALKSLDVLKGALSKGGAAAVVEEIKKAWPTGGKNLTGLQRSLHALGFIFGAKVAFDKSASGEYLQAIEGAARATESGLEFISGVATAAQAGNGVAKSSSRLARFLPVVGLAADALAVAADAGKLVETGNAGYAVKILGDFFCLAGNVPVIGAIGDAVGFAVDAAGEWLVGAIDDEEQRKQLAARLTRLDPRKFDAATAATLARADLQLDPLGPAQLVELARRWPQALKEDHRLLTVLAQGKELRPSEVMCLLEAVELDAKARGAGMHDLLDAAEQRVAMGYADQYSRSEPGSPARERAYRALLSVLGETPNARRYLEGLR